MLAKVKSDFDGKTLKEWLKYSGFSHGLITRLKKLPDGITVNGAHATVRYILHEGDIISTATDDRADDENPFLVPVNIPIDIIFEDEDIIAVNKPPHMATHPSLGHYEDTLANGIAYYFSSRGIPFVFRAINRLDRDTSGVILIAKTRLAAAKYTSLMQSGKIKKKYIAVLCGVLTPPDGIIDAPIRRVPGSVMLRETCEHYDPGAKTACTVFRTVSSAGDASVVEAEPVTGRTHQLRVHFAHMGCPIAGDEFYGHASDSPTPLDGMIGRQALHASELIIETEEKQLVLRAQLPQDILSLKRHIEGEKHK